MFVAVLLHFVVKNFVGHEHVAPELGCGAFVALGHVEDFPGGWLKVGAPNATGVNGHGHLDHDFVFVDAGARLPGVFAQVGQERQTQVLNRQAGHGVGCGQPCVGFTHSATVCTTRCGLEPQFVDGGWDQETDVRVVDKRVVVGRIEDVLKRGRSCRFTKKVNGVHGLQGVGGDRLDDATHQSLRCC